MAIDRTSTTHQSLWSVVEHACIITSTNHPDAVLHAVLRYDAANDLAAIPVPNAHDIADQLANAHPDNWQVLLEAHADDLAQHQARQSALRGGLTNMITTAVNNTIRDHYNTYLAAWEPHITHWVDDIHTAAHHLTDADPTTAITAGVGDHLTNYVRACKGLTAIVATLPEPQAHTSRAAQWIATPQPITAVHYNGTKVLNQDTGGTAGRDAQRLYRDLETNPDTTTLALARGNYPGFTINIPTTTDAFNAQLNDWDRGMRARG